jgi:hypothetical protein
MGNEFDGTTDKENSRISTKTVINMSTGNPMLNNWYWTQFFYELQRWIATHGSSEGQ